MNFCNDSATVELALIALFMALVLGISVGVLAAIKRYSVFDYSSMTFALAGISMPVFWLGLMLIYIFSVQLGWLPVFGRLSDVYYLDGPTGFYLIDSLIARDYGAFVDTIKHLILPSIVLATVSTAVIARMTQRKHGRKCLKKIMCAPLKLRGATPLG